ncbi:hypothetical protein QBC35DRAFT_552850 [Podospora australis]|uniref:Uncharacterized protein n=1 Tax=Podospora australis TaxID=1536484 RepID=A0AAN6X1X6_9PEZI|nr:hypothetical protein QBC35DRAFT_552850 [Podospora australis]
MAPSDLQSEASNNSSDSEESGLDTVNLQAPPNWPFWEIEGFHFDDSTVEELAKKVKLVWSALCKSEFTNIPGTSKSYQHSRAVIKLRVQNNVAVVFRALLFFGDLYEAHDFHGRIAELMPPQVGKVTFQLLAKAYSQARKNHVRLWGSVTQSPVALLADEWDAHVAGFVRDISAPTPNISDLTKDWDDLKQRGGLINLGQQTLWTRNIAHHPKDRPDVVVLDDSPDNSPQLPTATRAVAEPSRSNNKRKVRTDPITPRKPSAKRRAPATATPRANRTVEFASSPPLPRLPSGNTSLGLSPSPSSIQTPDTQRPSGARDNTASTQIRSLDLAISGLKTTVASLSNRVNAVEVDLGLRQGPESVVKQIETRVQELDQKLNKKHSAQDGYVSNRVKIAVAAALLPSEQQIKTFSEKLDKFGETLAVEKNQREQSETEIQGKLRKLRGKERELRAIVDKLPDQSTAENNEDDVHAQGHNCISKAKVDKLMEENKRLISRVETLEKSPGTQDLQNEVTQLRIDNSKLKDSIAELKTEFQAAINGLWGFMGHHGQQQNYNPNNLNYGGGNPPPQNLPFVPGQNHNPPGNYGRPFRPGQNTNRFDRNSR